MKIFTKLLFFILFTIPSLTYAQIAILTPSNITNWSGTVSTTGVVNSPAISSISSTSYKGFVRFDLSGIPTGAIISSATLRLKTTTGTISSTTTTNKITVSTINTLTATGIAINSAIASSASTDAYTGSWSGTPPAIFNMVFTTNGISQLQAALANGFATIGIIRGTSSAYFFFDSSAASTDIPQLTVAYTVPTTPPNCINSPIYPTNIANTIPKNTTLSWSNATGFPTGYDVYLDTNPSPTTLVSSNQSGTTFIPLSILLPTTTYFWKVVPRNVSGSSTGCVTWSFTTGTSLTYCVNAATSTVDDDIARVTLGSMSNPISSPSPLVSNAAANRTYTDFTALTPVNLTQGLIYPISVQAFFSGNSYLNWVTAYIDYNQNGTFETTEIAFSQANNDTSPFITSGNVTIPITAIIGNTRMRIILVEYGSSSNGPCSTFSFGEVEDYNINIIAAPNCMGTPAAATTTASTTTVCSGVAFSLGLTSSNMPGLTYQWQSSPTGTGIYSPISGATSTTYSTTQSVATDYRCLITCTNSNSFINSTPVTVSQNLFTTCYCTASASTINDEDILNVKLGALDNTSDCTFPAPGAGSVARRYANYTSGTGAPVAPQIYQGINTPFSVTIGTCGGSNYLSGIAIYIDYNQNGMLENTEKAYTSGGTASIGCLPATVNSGNILIPTTAKTGLTLMRIINSEGTSGNAITACAAGAYGEVEDYFINIVAVPTCSGSPNAGTATATSTLVCSTNGSSDISLTGATNGVLGLSYQWQSSPDGITFSDLSNATNSTYTATLITNTTTYRCNMACYSSVISSSTPVSVSVTDCNQTVNYNSAKPYNSIINSGTSATWTSTTDGDDNVTLDLPIGFPFLHKGQVSTVCRASTNGWLSLSSTTSTSYINDLSTNATPRVIAPMWDDLVVTGGSSSNGTALPTSFKYQTAGSAPNRTFTAEWLGMEQYGHAGPNLNFQVVLHETTNAFEINYGTMEGFNGTVNLGYTYSIGVNGNIAGDYYALQTERSNFFGTVSSNSLAVVPECNSSYSFTTAAAYSSGTTPINVLPANDEATTAFTIPVNSQPCTAFCGTYYTTKGATASSQAVCAGVADDDVWFKFVATTDAAKITVLGSYGFNPRIELLDGSLTSISCTVNVVAPTVGGTASYSTLPNALTPGSTYYVRVYHDGIGFGTSVGVGALTGAFAICVSEINLPPLNDECISAINLNPSLTCAPINGRTISATASVISITTTCSTPDDDVWYKFTPTISTPTINIQSLAGFNAALQVFSGTCTSLTSLACINNTSTAGLETYTGTALTPGNTYYIRAFHAVTGTGTGNFTICNIETPPACPVLISPVEWASNVSTPVTLSWNAVDGATGYDIYLGTSLLAVNNYDISVLVGSTTSDLTFTTLSLSPNKIYSWIVVAKNIIGSSINCNARHFITAALPPVNDDPCNATALVLNTPFVCQNTTSASVSTIETGSNLTTAYTTSVLNNTVWFKYTPTVTSTYRLNMSSPPSSTLVMNTWASIYTTDCSISPLVFTQIMVPVSNVSAAGVNISTITPTLNAGITYYFLIDGISDSNGDFCIKLEEVCQNAIATSQLTIGNNILNTMCDDGSDYTYYGIGNQYSLGVKWGVNTMAKAAATANIIKYSTPPSIASGANSTFILPSVWNVNAPTQPTTPVTVRVYYTQADSLAAAQAAQAFATSVSGTVTPMVWFKSITGVFDPSDPQYNSGNGSIPASSVVQLTPTYGTHPDANGTTMRYVEFLVSSFSGGTSAVGAGGLVSPLPIVFKNFKGFVTGNSNTIAWEAGVQSNTKEYHLERSVNGSDWSVIATVASNATLKYSTIDANPVCNAYYRVIGVDNDSKTWNTQVVNVTRRCNKFNITSVYPVPTDAKTTIQYESVGEASVSLTLTDLMGRVLFVQNELNAKDGFNNVEVDLSSFASGTYFVTLNNGIDQITQRLIKK